jgi:hypothetical protein
MGFAVNDRRQRPTALPLPLLSVVSKRTALTSTPAGERALAELPAANEIDPSQCPAKQACHPDFPSRS